MPRVLVICSTKTGGAHWMASLIAECLSESRKSESILLSPSSHNLSLLWRLVLTTEVYLLEMISKVLRRAVTKYDYYFLNFGLSSISASLWVLLNRHKFDTILILWRSYFIGSTIIKILSKLGKKVVIYHTDHAALTGGCHFQNDCLNASRGCKKCPAILPYLQFMPAANRKNAKEIAQVATSISPNKNFLNQIRRSDVAFKSEHTQYFPVSDVYFREAISPRSRRRLVFVSSKIDDSRKGLELVLRCFKQYQAGLKQFDLTLCFVGAGSSTNIGIRGLGEVYSVEAHENLSPSSLAALYAKTFAIINVPRQDIGPSTAFEALSAGALIVSSSIGIGPELISECGGGDVMLGYSEEALYYSITGLLQMSSETYLQKLKQIECFTSSFRMRDFAGRLECYL